MPANCDGCGAASTSSLEHALDCQKRGLVTQRHNEDRDVIGDLASIIYKEVPVVQEANYAEGVSSLIADLSIRGVWQRQTMVLLDVRVTDTDTSSHSRVGTAILLLPRTKKKKRKYSEAITYRRASFVHLVVPIDGVLG